MTGLCHESTAAQEGREAVGECRYCANTGWFYGDPDLKTFCGCDFGKLREELSASAPAQPAAQVAILPEGTISVHGKDVVIAYDDFKDARRAFYLLESALALPTDADAAVVTDDEVERASQAVIAEWKKMVAEMHPHLSVADAARSFVSPGNYRLIRASLTAAKAGEDGQGALVERLRNLAKSWAGPFDEAADRIEALTRENAALRADKERLERENETYRTAFDGIEPAAQEGREAVAWTNRLSDSTKISPIETPEFDIPLYPAPAQPAAQVVVKRLLKEACDFISDERDALFQGHSVKGELRIECSADRRAARAVSEMDDWLRRAGAILNSTATSADIGDSFGHLRSTILDAACKSGDKDEILAIIDDLESALASPTDADAAVEAEYFDGLVKRAKVAAAKASKKFPQPNYVTLKIAEEAGEVVRGAVHYAENRMEWQEVEGEIVQLLAMLIRFVTEGDRVNGIVPPLTAAKAGEDGRHG